VFAKVKPNTQIIGQNIIYFNQVASTNEFALELIKQNLAENGTVVIAEFQSKGRGQYGKSWISEPFENLMFSIILKHVTKSATDPFTINKIITLAMFQQIQRELPNDKVVIKWPNDILVNGKKICGILVENNFSGNLLNHSVIGIGLNVNQPFEHVLQLNATSLKDCIGYTIDRELVLKSCLETFETLYLEYIDKGNAAITEQFNQALYGYNTNGSFDIEGNISIAKVMGCDALGQLILDINCNIHHYPHGSIKQIIA
jgi:BirA family biotin operon repressor/biotin-[acetyl-CoA-carboxylase] ligase